MDGSRFPRSFVVAAALVAILVRLAFGLGYWVNEVLNRDEVEYLSLARSLAAGHGYDFDEYVKQGDVQPFGRAPGYPVFLALVGAGRAYTSTVPASVKIAQSIVGGIGVLLVGWAAFRMAGRRPAIAAAATAAIYPPLVWISGFVYSEALFWPIGLAVALAFNHVLDQPRERMWKSAIAFGLLTGVAVLVRAATLPFVPLAALWLLWKRHYGAVAGLAVGLAVVLTPWTIRNYEHHGRFVLVASDGGVTFWTGNNPLATGEGDMAANPRLKYANQELRAQHPQLTEEQLEPIYYRESLTWMRQHPAAWLWLMVKKAFYLVVPIGPSYRVHSTRYYVASLLSVGLLLPLAAFGGWRLGARRSRMTGMWILAAGAVATCLVFFPQERFRIPVLDPALILLASGAWCAGRRDLADEEVQQKVA
jgi:4-amino-4-deoxy-L-arabinose transferase-like glycosyltransferase